MAKGYSLKGEESNTQKGAVGKWRLLALFAAFLVILINPFLNYHYHFNFVQGWYQSLGIGELWFVSPLEGIESFLTAKSIYLPSLVGMVIPVLLALLLGRVFCSWICPVTFFLELFDRLRKKVSGKKYLLNRLIVAKRFLWFVLIGELLLSMILGAPVFVFLSPPGLVGREIMMLVYFGSVAFEGILLLVILFLELVTRRFFCRTFCPLGGLLALLGRRRRLKVLQNPQNCVHCMSCDQSCPMGLQVSYGESMGSYCWNCGECVDSCRHDALGFVWQENKSKRYTLM